MIKLLIIFILFNNIHCCFRLYCCKQQNSIDIQHYIEHNALQQDPHETNVDNPCFIYDFVMRGNSQIHMIFDLSNEFICQKYCFNFQGCKYFTFHVLTTNKNICKLYDTVAHTIGFPAQGIITGLKTCKINDIIYDMNIDWQTFISLLNIL